MARLWSSGAESQSVTANVEFTSATSSGATIDTSTFRSGAASLLTNNNSEEGFFRFTASDTAACYYFRAYFRITDLPAALAIMIRLRTAAGGALVSVRANSDGTLELWNDEDTAQVDVDSTALSLNTWYRLELKLDATTLSSTSVEAKIDGTTFASGTIALATGVSLFGCGVIASSFIANIDDLAINDTSGSFENSWPGEGEIIHLRPSAAGDNADWDVTSAVYTSIDEVTPNDATDFIDSTTDEDISDFNIDDTPAALESDDTINCVQVGWRFNDSTSIADFAVVLRIKSDTGGTVEESAAQTIPDSTWKTNKIAVPYNYHLTLYDLPGASTTAWTKADLDTAQIGVRVNTDGGVGATQTSTLWLLVDHKPGEAPPEESTVSHSLGLTGVGA